MASSRTPSATGLTSPTAKGDSPVNRREMEKRKEKERRGRSGHQQSPYRLISPNPKTSGVFLRVASTLLYCVSIGNVYVFPGGGKPPNDQVHFPPVSLESVAQSLLLSPVEMPRSHASSRSTSAARSGKRSASTGAQIVGAQISDVSAPEALPRESFRTAGSIVRALSQPLFEPFAHVSVAHLHSS